VESITITTAPFWVGFIAGVIFATGCWLGFIYWAHRRAMDEERAEL
jgi:cbb3-type cytochrome oxidase subunit 3